MVVLQGDEAINSHIGLIDEPTLTRMAQKALDRAAGRTLGSRIKRLFVRGARPDPEDRAAVS